MIEYKTSKNARILFVGINPHPGSYRRGVPFSNNKMFWYLLNRAGLLQEDVSDLKDDRKLKHIYDDKFVEQYDLNFVNLVDRPTVKVTELHKGEELQGRSTAAESYSNSEAESGLLHREDCLQHVLWQPGVRLGLAVGDQRRESLSHALPSPRAGGSPSEGTQGDRRIERNRNEEMNIKLKRAYEKPDKSDGTRILVDRLWPRGLTKAKAAIDLWLKEIAPSTELRKWFAHDPKKWKGFRGGIKRNSRTIPISSK